MKIRGILDTDHVNYKKISMTIIFPYCDFKCDRECGQQVCQNSPLINEPIIDIDYDKIVDRYMSNPLTEAIVFQGLEPFDSREDVYELVKAFRNRTDDDIVIYTGYDEQELILDIGYFQKFPLKNIIIKFGRYIPGQQVHKDQVLGVNLASDNQYAVKIR